MDRIPNMMDFESRRVTNPGQSEVVRQRLYDYALYPAAGSPQIPFFALPLGQGITTAQGAAVGSAKTQADTNIELANSLPSGKTYMIETVEIVFFPGSVSAANTYTPAAISLFAAVAAAALAAQANDVNVFYQSGVFELNISSKNYLRESPVQCFPPKAFTDFTAAVSSNSATTGLVAAMAARATGRPYILDPSITLQPLVNFEAIIRYPGLVPMPSTFNARVGVIFDGFLGRASQ